MGIYEELGVKRIINGAATLTAIGGSIMPPEVLDSMKEASQSYVSIIEPVSYTHLTLPTKRIV